MKSWLKIRFVHVDEYQPATSSSTLEGKPSAKSESRAASYNWQATIWAILRQECVLCRGSCIPARVLQWLLYTSVHWKSYDPDLDSARFTGSPLSQVLELDPPFSHTNPNPCSVCFLKECLLCVAYITQIEKEQNPRQQKISFPYKPNLKTISQLTIIYC